MVLPRREWGVDYDARCEVGEWFVRDLPSDCLEVVMVQVGGGW